MKNASLAGCTKMIGVCLGAIPLPSVKIVEYRFDRLFDAPSVGRKKHRTDAEFILQHRAFMREGAEPIKPMGIADAGIADPAKGQIFMCELHHRGVDA